MSKTYRKERTKPKTTKPSQKDKYNHIDTYEAYTEIFEEMYSIPDPSDEDYCERLGICFCEESDIEHCGKCYTIVDGELVHQDNNIEVPRYFKDVIL